MKITAIRNQEKRKNRYSIYIDDRYAFSLSESALLELKLFKGQGIDKAQFKNFKQLSTDDKLYNQTLRYAVLRQRSEWEIEFYLKRKKVEVSTAHKILAKLQDLGFIDDTKFAKMWVENRRMIKPISRRKLMQELKQKRVASEIIDQTLKGDETDESAVLKELLTKKRRQAKYRDEPQKLIQYLARQGFNYEDIKSAM